MKTKAKTERQYFVTLKNGSDWRVRALNAADAIKKVKQGCGVKIGQYMQRRNKDSAEAVEG